MNGDKKPADLVPLPSRAWKFRRLCVVAGALLLTLLGVVAWQRSSPARAWKALAQEVFENQGSVAWNRPDSLFNTFFKTRAPALLTYLPMGLPESCTFLLDGPKFDDEWMQRHAEALRLCHMVRVGMRDSRVTDRGLGGLRNHPTSLL